VVRGQSDDDHARPAAPVAVALVMPSPEQLGVAASPAARFDRVGASSLHMEKLANGACRVSCHVPTEPGRTRRFEAHAASADEATRLVLEAAEKHQSRK